MKYFYTYPSPIGQLWIAEENNAITNITIFKVDGIRKETQLIQQCYNELNEYFHHKRQHFTFPIHYKDTPFREQCYQALQKIPYGTTQSYKDLAIAISNPKASRAVGGAIHNNPLLIVIPCHRIIQSNGNLGGFGAGIENKIKLLEIERKDDSLCKN